MKLKQIYVCEQCGSQSPKWLGQCTDCGSWNSFLEEVISAGKSAQSPAAGGYAAASGSQVTHLRDVPLQAEARLSAGSEELDRVLGGGLVAGSVVLIGGDPGIGKSTLLLQTLCHLSKSRRALYVTGEESLQQVTLRARRLELPQEHLQLLAETHVERIIAVAQQHSPEVLVIDSVQTLYTNLLTSAPGSVSQVRESTAQLVRYAKQANVALFLVGHVTKEGTLAGPRVLEHMVDTVLYFEGERDSRFRVIRAVKNRFGAANELGIFAMSEGGLREVTNPSAIFLSHYDAPIAGSVVMVSWEGSRPLLVEVQALVDESHWGNPRRVTVGLEQNRLAMLLAVLHRHGGIATYNQDVFVNVVGGVRVSETAADLAQVFAVLSSLKNKPLPSDLVIFGEIGLAGEIRPVQSGQERLREASKHGFKRAIVPKANLPKNKSISGMEVIGVQHLQEAIGQGI
ncbi:MAG TPA: DNA repair protein RadA [Gammaproteobacteria bacterium]|nr:DNA repair protein RadA [Gammaproteobacteria bacterium]